MVHPVEKVSFFRQFVSHQLSFDGVLDHLETWLLLCAPLTIPETTLANLAMMLKTRFINLQVLYHIHTLYLFIQ